MNIHVIDSHTEGEPTRVLIEGAPDLGSGPVAEQAKTFAENHDHLRRAMVLEPRGSDVLVGAILIPPSDPSADFATKDKDSSSELMPSFSQIFLKCS